MAKKGILTSAVETAVKAAERVLAPSPLAKRMVAAAASQAIAVAEQHAREALEPLDKAVKKATKASATEQRGKLKQQDEDKQTQTKPSTSSGRKSAARKSASSRKSKTTKSASARGRATGASKTKSGGRKKQSKSKRR